MASLAEYQVQDQLRRTGLEASNQSFQNINTMMQQIQARKDKQQKEADYKNAAAQAADAWKNGDKNGAMSILMQHDPELATKVFSGYGDEQGKLSAEKEQGQLPTQVAAAKAQMVSGGGFKDINLEGPDGSVIKMKMDKKTGKVYDLNGDVAEGSQLAGMKAGFAPAVTKNVNTGEAEIVSKGGLAKNVSESGAAVEKLPDNTAVVLTPNQNKGLQDFTKSWNTDKENVALTQQIQALETAKAAVVNNAPGGQVLEQMRLIRGVSPRPAVQEVMALNYGKGWETQMESYATKAAGTGMAPQEQKNFLSMIETYQKANLDNYNALLHQRVGQASENLKQGDQPLDPAIVLKRIAPSMPTPIQENLKKLSGSSPEDQQAVEWAHKTLLNFKSKKEDSDQALEILRLHGL